MSQIWIPECPNFNQENCTCKKYNSKKSSKTYIDPECKYNDCTFKRKQAKALATQLADVIPKFGTDSEPYPKSVYENIHTHFYNWFKVPRPFGPNQEELLALALLDFCSEQSSLFLKTIDNKHFIGTDCMITQDQDGMPAYHYRLSYTAPSLLEALQGILCKELIASDHYLNFVGIRKFLKEDQEYFLWELKQFLGKRGFKY